MLYNIKLFSLTKLVNLTLFLYFCQNLETACILAHYNDIEQQLVESLRRGSVDAFNVIYSLYASKLLRYISNATKNKEDAEEIVHDVFMCLWKVRKGIKIGTNISSLLFSIAYKRRIDFFRKSLNAPIYEDYIDFQNELATEENSNLEYMDFCNIFNQALKILPSRLQKFIVLSRIEGLTVDEIASRMNVSNKTVNNGIYEGLKLLKEQLKSLMNNNTI